MCWISIKTKFHNIMGSRYLLLVFLLILLQRIGTSQDPVCIPDESYADSLVGVYPGPYHPELFPDGGIHDTACINHPFELVLTAVISDSITYGGLSFYFNYLQIEEDGVLNLPEGLDYACNPPNCRFETNTLGCMLISGTPTEGNEIRNYDLKLKSEILIANFLKLNDTLPELLIPGSNYYLYLDSEDSEHCQELSAWELFTERTDLRVMVNPVTTRQIPVEFSLDKQTGYELQLVNLYGQVIQSVHGQNTGRVRHVFDLSDAAGFGHRNVQNNQGGYFLIRLLTPRGTATEKVLILAP
jgi:hypothetical protein